jgi:DnaK suppressor protein
MSMVVWTDPRTRSRFTTAGGPAVSGIPLADLSRTLQQLRDAEHMQLVAVERASSFDDGFVERRRMLAEIEAALRRLDEGSYGACHGCGGVISTQRLQAEPYARYCAGCEPTATTVVEGIAGATI